MERNRTHPAVISYWLYLYFNFRSYRCASKCLDLITKRTHVSIWKWVQKYANCADRFKVNKHLVKEIFVDETLIQIDGQAYWLWIAYEPNINSCLMMHLSKERTIFICYHFFLNNLGLDIWQKTYPYWWSSLVQWHACKWLRLKHHVYGVELKNVMERFIQKIKDRTECFDDHFPCRKEKCDRQHVNNWLKMFVLYLHMGMNRIRFMKFLLIGGG